MISVLSEALKLACGALLVQNCLSKEICGPLKPWSTFSKGDWIAMLFSGGMLCLVDPDWFLHHYFIMQLLNLS
jgi:hypothetical protein